MELAGTGTTSRPLPAELVSGRKAGGRGGLQGQGRGS